MHTNDQLSAQVSVIIPTLNAGLEFEQLLVKLQEQTHLPHEIIVIDSESTDGTCELAREAGVRLLQVKRSEFDHGGTRNQAATLATGNILVFMTQDAMPHDNRLIEYLIKPLVNQNKISVLDGEMFEDNKIALSYARQLPRHDASLPERLARESNYPSKSHIQSIDQLDSLGIKTFFCSNVCSAIKRETFDEMGQFQEPVIFNEDLFMAAKCILNGYKVAYCAEAEVAHSHNYSIKQQFKRFFDNGVSMRLNPLITPYSAVGGAGSKLVRSQVKGLTASGSWYLVPHLIVESAAKLIGFKLGMYHKSLPKFFIKRISMHPLIWGQLDRKGGTVETPPAPTTLNQ
ncbi:glycosyltransferase [Paenibacillus sp. GSMTC-2017]|uniref:glycosyltransferase family 2 protein n=1 Tax=Paenibacillus sp. GSMTC-2017 TaxID=2794350 RepID=UPI0018D8167D|nr:glycosyltransferase [Paenibacillus sp. GSMTC-2017]MBH5319152.1 glycosyltransferase [Paenibacillus sp. GSMTC-2017]